MALALRVVALVSTFVGFRSLSLGDALTRVGAMCRDASTAPHGTPVEDSRHRGLISVFRVYSSVSATFFHVG